MRRWSASCSRQREAAAGLVPCPCRAAPPQRDAGAAVAGLSRPASRWLRLEPLLRPLRRMAPRRDDDHAPDPCRGREAVCGLCRRHHAGVRCDHRGGARYQDLRRGSGGLELHLCQSPLQRGLPDWIGAHVNALAFLGGVPKAIVCDNLKAGVTTASRYEPGVNRTY
jgi:hypothetical protein